MQVTQYNGKPQLVAKIQKAKECSFCLFDGSQEVSIGPHADTSCLVRKMRTQQLEVSAAQAGNTPYQVSSEHFTLEERDPGIISALRAFGKLLNSTNLSGSTAYLRRIKDIRPGAFFDTICRVCDQANALHCH